MHKSCGCRQGFPVFVGSWIPISTQGTSSAPSPWSFRTFPRQDQKLVNTKESVTDNRWEGNRIALRAALKWKAYFLSDFLLMHFGTLLLFTSISPEVKTQSRLFLFLYIFYYFYFRFANPRVSADLNCSCQPPGSEHMTKANPISSLPFLTRTGQVEWTMGLYWRGEKKAFSFVLAMEDDASRVSIAAGIHTGTIGGAEHVWI